jgi:hypothetical protein
MDKYITLTSGYKTVRSRPLLGGIFNIIKDHIFGVGIYTIAVSILGINLDPSEPTMKLLSILGIILGIIASALGVTTKGIELYKALRNKQKAKRSTSKKKTK